jgi:hypothetical protein
MALKAGITNLPSIPPGQWFIGPYTFDTWLTCSQNDSVTHTQHPVETGANITDHAYNNPIQFTFEIGVTDTVTAPAFNGQSSRSINAHNLLVELMRKREFVSINTKYGKFDNNLIINISTNDTAETQYASVMTVTLVQIIVANASTYRVSGIPQSTDTTNRGNVVPQLNTQAFTDYILKKIAVDARLAGIPFF